MQNTQMDVWNKHGERVKSGLFQHIMLIQNISVSKKV